ncbi:glycosyl transferase [candidate division KSB3 bacterium]|uniref:Glycosyl transferase n=1 Tax=candidate division KSB3 bacterium TaxID=2044937 RepID=A0A2G6E500_9BACT|nr:MAG: glycosyl transferase [candidate division KSB3 bacterium]PIE28358.1 MAG: glycosyl transferase [candidate division KSB3 bacterium]
MKLAIVHDGLATDGGRGGAEWVLTVLKEVYPEAPVYTTVYNKERMPGYFQDYDIRPSFLQHFPYARKNHRLYLPLMPTAVEQFDLREFDVVLSCSHSVVKGVVTPPHSRHLCYCYTPLRYAWDMYHEYMALGWKNRFARLLIPPLLTYIRTWDCLSSNRVDEFIAISAYAAQRIRKYYRRDSRVVYPPVDCARFRASDTLGPYFLVVSRLESYKRIDVAVQAFNQLGLPLVIIGDGSERKQLQNIAQKNIRFLGRQPDEIVREHLAACQALIFPGEEDFGITPVEAQASGRPVIAYRGGGALETVSEGNTGVFFDEKNAVSLAEAVRQFDATQFDQAVVLRHARHFDISVFRKKMQDIIGGELDTPRC